MKEVSDMVRVYFGIDNTAILDIDSCFDGSFDESWLEDDVVKQMIKDIEGSDVLSPQCIQNPIFGQKSPYDLSGGVKACIMLYKLDDFYVDLCVCGENCQEWLAWIFSKKDCHVAMSGCDLTFDNTVIPIKGICENDARLINNSHDWVEKMCYFRPKSVN